MEQPEESLFFKVAFLIAGSLIFTTLCTLLFPNTEAQYRTFASIKIICSLINDSLIVREAFLLTRTVVNKKIGENNMRNELKYEMFIIAFIAIAISYYTHSKIFLFIGIQCGILNYLLIQIDDLISWKLNKILDLLRSNNLDDYSISSKLDKIIYNLENPNNDKEGGWG